MSSGFEFGSGGAFGDWAAPPPRDEGDESRYRALFAGGDSETLTAIWEAAYGSEFAPEAESFGFATRSDFEYTTEHLGVGPGDRFLDVGCGGGGPGLWIVRRTGAAVLGVDIAPEAVAAARRRAADRGAADAYFVAASCAATGLTTQLDGAVAFDSLWMVVDKVAALSEVARLLPSGARLIITTWEPSYLSYEGLLDGAGFDTDDRFVAGDWRAPQLAVYQGILERRRDLERELGAAATQVLVDEATETPPLLADTERLRLLAVRR
jgi:SAM-dependent methyltransferase